MRRLFLILAILGLAAGQARGQCQPSNQPTFNVPKPQAVDPSKVPFAAVTLTFGAADGSTADHKMTVGNNTMVTIGWKGYNTAPLTNDSNSGLVLTYSLDNGPQGSPWYLPTTMSGSVNFTFEQQYGWAGHVAHFRMTAKEKPGSGSFSPTTQDIVSVTITNQAAGIYYEDGNNSNVYWFMRHTYSGTPQIDFNTCQQAAEKPGIPTATMQIYNASSGESRNGVTFQGSTGVIDDQNLLSATASDYISALPGDTIKVSYGGQMFCSAIGNFWGVQNLFRVEGAVTIVADLGHPPVPGPEKPVPSAIYDVAPICQNNCDPPDWEPTKVHSWSGRHPYWVGECQLLRIPDLDGVPWTPLCDFMDDVAPAFGKGLVPTTIQLATGGLSLPYPGPAPDLPIPGKCTKYPVNVLFTVGPQDLANFFKNVFGGN